MSVDERSPLIRKDTPMRAPERTQRAPGVATRRRLLDAGRRIFARDGVSGASTQDIAREAGVAPTALYHHFGSKAGLFVAVSKEVYDEFVAGLTAAVDGAADFDAAVLALIAAAGDIHREDPSLAQLTITVMFEVRHSATLREELKDSLSIFRSLADRVARMAPPEVLEPGGARATAVAITGLMQGLCSLAVTMRDPEDFATAAAALGRMFGH